MPRSLVVFSVLAVACAAAAQTTLAVLDLRPGAGVNVDECVILTERLISELTNTGAFTVMDRTARDARLQQMAYEQTGIVSSNDQLAQIGQELGVGKMLLGTVGRLGQTWTVSVRIVDVNRGVSERSIPRDYRGEIDDLLGVMRDIALELSGQAAPRETGSPSVTVQTSRAYTETYYSESTRAITDRDVESWMDRDGWTYTRREGKETWDLSFTGNYGQSFSLIVSLKRNNENVPTYVTFWAYLLESLPSNLMRNDKKMRRLTEELVAHGFNSWLSKAVVDEDNAVGTMVELPAEGLTYDAFTKGLSRCINGIDELWPIIQNYL